MNGLDQIKAVCIVGCGLIGGSFALALRRAGYTGRLTSYGGRRSAALAVERGVVDSLEDSFERGESCNADLIYLAAPIGGIIDFLKTRSGQVKPGAIVTDAGSTKLEITRVARESLPDGVHFIGGHPMAGSEQTGVEYARGDLFDRAVYVITPDDQTDAGRLHQFKSIVTATGARVVTAQPAEHDRAVALISHLPQLTASALASLLGADHDGDMANRLLAQRLAASGWRDMTRLAGSSWSVWRDICLTNQSNIVPALDQLIAELSALRDALDNKDFNYLRELFGTANQSLSEQREVHYKKFEQM